MDEIRRIFVEKKEAFAVEARGLLADLQTNLGMKGLTGIRVINRYDVMGVTDEEFAAAKALVLSEPPVDTVEEELEVPAGCRAFAVEFLPGQYNQREDFAAQCIQLITQKERPLVSSAKVYILSGTISDDEFAKQTKNLTRSRLTALTRLKHAKLPGKNRRLWCRPAKNRRKLKAWKAF